MDSRFSLDVDLENYAIKAYAGPTSKEQAEELYGALKKSGVRRSIALSRQSSPIIVTNGNDSKLADFEKEMGEGDSHTNMLSPYSPIINALRTPSSPIFTSRKHASSTPCMSPCMPDHTLRARDAEKGLERIAQKVSSQRNIPWLEYWNFMEDFANFSCLEGLNKLEEYLMKKESFLLLLNDSLPDEAKLVSSVFKFRFPLLKQGEHNMGNGDGEVVIQNDPSGVNCFTLHRETKEVPSDDDDEDYRSANSTPVREIEQYSDCDDRVVYING